MESEVMTSFGEDAKPVALKWRIRSKHGSVVPCCDRAPPRKVAGNPDSPKAVVFLTSIIDLTLGS